MEPPLWTEGASPWLHEREAFAFVRARLPNHEPYRAWTNVEFIADDGSVNEVDLLVVTTRGLFLVEIKSFPGVLYDSGQRWRLRFPSGHEKTYDHPLILTNTKAKRLRSLLARQPAFKSDNVPFVTALVFLSSAELTVRLHDVGSLASVCGRDSDHLPGSRTAQAGPPSNDALPGIVEALKDPSKVNLRGTTINRPTSARIVAALETAGIHASNRGRRVGDWDLGELLDEGPGWQDHVARRDQVTSRRRVRTYLTGMATTQEEQDRLRREAEREFRVVEGLHNRGIAHPLDLVQAERGPALLFDFADDEERLDLWALEAVATLPLDERIEMVRQLAEAVDYAHGHRVTHRALTPRSVLVRPAGAASQVAPTLVIGHWQAGARDLATNLSRHPGTTSVLGTVLTERTEASELVYLAPEAFNAEHPDGVALDVFSLGAIAFLLLTGRPPAADLVERQRMLVEHRGLLNEAASDLPGELAGFVAFATDPDPHRRPNVRDLLVALDDALESLTAPDPDDEPAPEASVDPLEAHRGDVLEGGWRVERRLGSGATAVALLCSREGTTEPTVLKVARDEEHAEVLADEARAMERLRDAGIVELYGIDRIGGRTVLRLAPAGNPDDELGMTLADRLTAVGRVGLDLLERFGDDLLAIVAYLESEGTPHRDIKPDNLGVRPRRGDRSLHLVLFDFSLSRTPDTSLTAGTVGYLDPFLAERPARRWDRAADRYAAAVTLYEMATGSRPTWGDGATDPLHLEDTVPRLDEGLFDPSVRDGLRSFFAASLARRPADRFDSPDQMRMAWRAVFAAAGRPATSDGDRPLDAAELERLADAAADDTPVVELGLSGLAASALERLGVGTVHQLLTFPAVEWNRVPGVGQRTKREVGDAVARLRARFDVDDIDPGASIDRLAPALVPHTSTAQTQADAPALALLLGLPTAKPELPLDPSPAGMAPPPPWPGAADLIPRFGLDRAGYDALLSRARGRWLKQPAVTQVRNDLAVIVERSGGVLAGDELALALLAARGSTATGDERRARARAVVRAAIETDAAREADRFTWRRLGGGASVVVALRTDELDGEELADYAASLGLAADQLATTDPLPSPVGALDRLRGVPVPPGLAPLVDHRLVRLATAASATAATSSRLEVYPRGLPAVRAVRLARATLLTTGTLPAEEVRRRVHVRFPAAAPLPTGADLTDLLRDTLGLQWHSGGEDGRGRPVGAGYRVPPPPAPPGATSLTSTSSRYRTGTAATVPDEHRVQAEGVEERLLRHAEAGGYLVLTVRPSRYRLAIDALSRLGPTVVSLDVDLIDALHHRAAEGRIRWDEAIIAADAAGPNGPQWPKLLQVVRASLDAVRTALVTDADHVLLSDAGLLARYGQVGLLDELRERTSGHARPGQALRTLWVLLPADDPAALPAIDGQPVPTVASTERLALPESWLRNTHRTSEPTGAAP